MKLFSRYKASLLILSWLLSNGVQAAITTNAEQQAANKAALKIQEVYDTNQLHLTPKRKAHYALRMYRLTGQEKYVGEIINHVYRLVSRVGWYDAHVNDEKFRLQIVDNLTSAFGQKSRGLQRRLFWQQTKFRALRFELHSIYLLAQLNQLGIKPTHFSNLLNHLQKQPIAKLLLDEAFIRVYAAQAANYVFWLEELGIAKLSEKFITKFQTIYPISKDTELSQLEYQNKLYGLTHIILSASRYYQKPVSDEQFAWITKYFVSTLDTIEKRAKADVLAEIGVCLKLVGFSDQVVLHRLKRQLLAMVDKKHYIIPGAEGNVSLSSGEHRNVLTYAFFNWPNQLTPGPNLTQTSTWRRQLPYRLSLD
ncbi:DUF3541 domain-containing protein [Zooshikella sp. RANM57]|uniref:DUF3541 domain-containing protein n=1 Tax=Zooshikella sp. RANM57 TaxID=3425863 RepID=UPI003D6DC8A0